MKKKNPNPLLQGYLLGQKADLGCSKEVFALNKMLKMSWISH